MNQDIIHFIYALGLTLSFLAGLVGLSHWLALSGEAEIERRTAEFEASLTSEEEIRDYAAYAPAIGRGPARKRIERMRQEKAIYERLMAQRHVQNDR